VCLRREYMNTLSRKEIKILIKYLPLFEEKVLLKVLQIPLGETRSYKWVAESIGLPKCARRVGKALSKNPYPFLIPCHRVIRANGALGGYVLGIEVKRFLLDLEKKAKSVIMKNVDKHR